MLSVWNIPIYRGTFPCQRFTGNVTIIDAWLRVDVDGSSFIIGHFQSLLIAGFHRRSQIDDIDPLFLSNGNTWGVCSIIIVTQIFSLWGLNLDNKERMTICCSIGAHLNRLLLSSSCRGRPVRHLPDIASSVEAVGIRPLKLHGILFNNMLNFLSFPPPQFFVI